MDGIRKLVIYLQLFLLIILAILISLFLTIIQYIFNFPITFFITLYCIILPLFLIIGYILLVHIFINHPLNINIFFTISFLRLTFHPLILSYLHIFDKFGLGFYDCDLGHFDEHSHLSFKNRVKKELGILREYNRNNLNTDQKMSYDIFEWWVECLAKAADYGLSLSPIPSPGPMVPIFPINHVFGLQTELINYLVQHHEITSYSNAQSYVKRCEKIETFYDELCSIIIKHTKESKLPQKYVIEQTALGLQDFIENNGKPLIDKLFRSLKTIQKYSVPNIITLIFNLSTHCQLASKLENQLITCVKNSIIPSTIRLQKCLQNISQYEYTSINESWMSEIYNHLVHLQVGTDIHSPKDIMELGYKEIYRIEQEIKKILIEAGWGNKIEKHQESVTKLASLYIKKNSKKYSDDDDKWSINALDYCQSILDNAIKISRKEFKNTFPRRNVQIKEIKTEIQKNIPPAYYFPGTPGNPDKPGTFFLKLLSAKDFSKESLKPLVYHEAVPGHHLQISIAQESKIPLFRRSLSPLIPGYCEGWALYAEKLADSWGLYTIPSEKLAYLLLDAWRSCRLVLDPGLHIYNWSRNQAIEYMREHSGLEDTIITSEVDRYMCAPGQAVCYKLGQLKIMELRDKSQKKLGALFDLASFHKMILTGGAMPFSLLEKNVLSWIEDCRSKTKQKI